MNRLLIYISLLLIAWSASSQSPDGIGNTHQPRGGRWMTKPGVTQIISVGQPAAANTLVSEDQVWSGSVGFLTPSAVLGKNLPPIAIIPGSVITLEDDLIVLLDGFDPEDDEIFAEIIRQPNGGTLESISDFEFTLTPDPNIIPDVTQLDSVVFRVKEKASTRSSASATLKFRYSVPDESHLITRAEVDVSGSTATLHTSWKDPRFNQSYRMVWSYYDLSNPNAPVFREMLNQNLPTSGLTKNNDTLSTIATVSQSQHPYFFAAERVFVSVLITSPNGNSDVASFIQDNASGGRIETSPDGLFFAFGSEMDVRENRSVNMQFMSVELGDFDVSASEIQLLGQPKYGTITGLVPDKSSVNLKSWKATYTSTAEVGGEDSVQFRVYHPERQLYDSAWVRINVIDVNDAPRIQELSNQVTDEETSLAIPIVANDPDSELEFVVTSSEASRVTTTMSNGTLTITPGQDFSGRVSITILAREIGDDELVAFRQFDLRVVDVNDPPVMASITDKQIDEDQQLLLAVTATDVDANIPLFTYSASVSDPTLIDIAIDESNISIIPKANVNGSFEISIFADDQLGTTTSLSAPETFTLVINSINDAPTILSTIKTQTIFDGMPGYSIDLGRFFYDIENGSDLTYSLAGNQLTNLSVTGDILTVNASDQLVGFEDVTITASDGEFEVAQTVTFVRSTTNSDITLAQPISNLELNEDFGSYELALDGVFVDAVNAAASFSYQVLGNNNLTVEVSESGNSLVITSEENFFGEDAVFLIASSSDKSAYTTFDISVLAVNDAPVIGDMSTIEVLEDLTSANQFVAASDVDDSFASLTLTSFSRDPQLVPAANIRMTKLNSGYNITATPVANQSGIARVGLILSDGDLVDSVEFEVNVAPVNDAPRFGFPQPISAIEDQAVSISLNSYFSDIENDPLSYTIVSKPSWINNTRGVLSGTPTNDFVGTNEISVSANDGNGGQVTGKLTIMVANTNDAPILVNEAGAVVAFQESLFRYEFPTNNFQDVDAGDELTYSFESYPDWLIINGLVLEGTPQYENIGDYQIVMKVTDAAGAEVSDVLDLSVEFTVYDVTVNVDITGECAETNKNVVASGAFDYNWYDGQGQLIQEGGATITLSGHPATEYFVEGVNEAGFKTPQLFAFNIDCPLGLSEGFKWQVYPNPAQDQITISGSVVDAQLLVMDALGRKYQPFIIGKSSKEITLDINELTSGIYFIRVIKGENQQVIKFIKSK